MIARRILAILLLAAVLAVGAWFWHWSTLRDLLPPSGGLYFPVEKIIEVPQFFQNDPRWGNDPLGPTSASLGAEGCALTSAAMVLASYGADVDPGRLNRFVTEIDGYTPQGWLYWEAAAAYPPALARHAYEDKASYALIDRNLLAGNPVIVRVRYPSGITHFVVIVGKRGFDYLIRDPGGGGHKGIYPLKEFGRPIEALRFYERLPSPLVTTDLPELFNKNIEAAAKD